MMNKEKLLDIVVIIIAIIYFIGLYAVPELIGNRYNY